MSHLLALGLANALCAAILAIPAYLVTRQGRRPALAHALWLLVLLKLITPPLIRPDLPWLPTPGHSQALASPEIPAPEPIPLAFETKVFTVVPPNSEATPAPRPLPATPIQFTPVLTRPVVENALPVPQAEAPVVAPALRVPRTGDVLHLVSALWLGGMVVCLSRASLHVLRFQRLLGHARRAPDELQELAARVARKVGLPRSPAIWLVPGPLPPMVWTLGWVRILFPAGLLDRLSPQECESLLAHELAHVSRRDHWVRVLELVVSVVYWWCPLVWWARYHLHECEEVCCDAWASSAVPPRVYASAILEAVDYLAESRRLPHMASGLAGMQSLKRRLTLIMTSPVPRCLGTTTRALVLGLGMALLPMMPVLVTPEPAQTAEAPQKVAATATLELVPEPTEYDRQTLDLLNPADDFQSVKFSPDDKQVAVGFGNEGQPGGVEVFDVQSRASIWTHRRARGVSSVSFTRDGKRLAWSGWGGQVQVRERAGWKPRLTLELNDQNARIGYSPDGTWLAAVTEGRQVRLYENQTGKLAFSLGGDLVDFYCLDFSSDSRYLAAGGGHFRPGGDNRALIWDLRARKQVARLEGHLQAVIGVAFAPNNRLVATASADRSVRIWDMATFKVRSVLQIHDAPVKGLAFSPDSHLLATGSWDRTVGLWEAETGKHLARLEGHPAAVREIAFSGDGKLLASAGSMRILKLWNVAERREVATLGQQKSVPGQGSVITMALSPDGTTLALGDDAGNVKLVDPATGATRHSLKSHTDAVTTLAISNDSRLLATGGPDSVVKVWDLGSGTLVRSLEGHTSWVYSLVFAPDAKSLVSGSYDRAVRYWSLETGRAQVLSGHKASIRALAISPDGKTLFSGGADRLIRVWDLETMAQRTTLKGTEGTIRALLATNTELLSGGEDGWLRSWDWIKGVQSGSVRVAPSGQVHTLALSPGGQLLAAGTDGGSLFLYDRATLALHRGIASLHRDGIVGLAFGPAAQTMYLLGGDGKLEVRKSNPSPIRHFTGHKGPVRIAVFSPDGKFLLSTGGWPEGDRTLRYWDVATGKARWVSDVQPTLLQSAAFSADGRLGYAGGEDGTIREWDLTSGKMMRTLAGHGAGVPHLLMSSDGKRMLSSSHDRTVRLWDTVTGKVVQTFHGHTDWARFATFHPDGKRILTGGRDRVIRIWDLNSGNQVGSIAHQNEWVEGIVVLPSGKEILSCGGNNFHRWELDTGKLVRSYTGHAFGVTSLAATRDGRRCLSVSYDGSTRIWDVESGQQLLRLGGHRNWVWSVALSPDGRSFVTAGGGGSKDGKHVPGDDFVVRLWRFPSELLARVEK